MRVEGGEGCIEVNEFVVGGLGRVLVERRYEV